jgi:hypothetical protein
MPHLVKELAIALLSPIRTEQQQSYGVGGEKCADGVEFRGEDLEDDEGETELREGGADVCAFEGPLGGADLDQLGICEVHGSGLRGVLECCACDLQREPWRMGVGVRVRVFEVQTYPVQSQSEPVFRVARAEHYRRCT